MGNNEKKGNVLLIGLIVVLILCLLGAVGYIVYDKVINKEEPIEENNKQEENKVIVNEKLDIESELVKNLYKKVDVFGGYKFERGNYWGYIFERNYSIDDISNGVKLYMAFANMNLGPEDGLSKTINAEDVKKSMFDVFGNIEYSNESVNNDCGGIFEFSKENNVYTRKPNGCGGSVQTIITTKLMSANKNNDSIELYQKMYYIEPKTEFGKINSYYYNSLNKKETLGFGNITDEQFVNKYGKFLNTYKYTFKYDAKTKKYYFDSVKINKYDKTINNEKVKKSLEKFFDGMIGGTLTTNLAPYNQNIYAEKIKNTKEYKVNTVGYFVAQDSYLINYTYTCKNGHGDCIYQSQESETNNESYKACLAVKIDDNFEITSLFECGFSYGSNELKA